MSNDFVQVVSLGTKDAIMAISNCKYVNYKHGVWNPYKVVPVGMAISAITNSGYGADVFKNSKGEFFVSVPCDSDMWQEIE